MTIVCQVMGLANNVNPRLINHGLSIRGVFLQWSFHLILKWYPPNETAVNGVYSSRFDIPSIIIYLLLKG